MSRPKGGCGEPPPQHPPLRNLPCSPLLPRGLAPAATVRTYSNLHQCPHFTNGESEAQRRNVISPQSPAESVGESRLEPRSSDCQAKALRTAPGYPCSHIHKGGWAVKGNKKLLASFVCTYLEKGPEDSSLHPHIRPPTSTQVANTWSSVKQGLKKTTRLELHAPNS